MSAPELTPDEYAAWAWKHSDRASDYDPECERLDTAIRAIWLLYRWAKWGLLAEIGMPRAEVEDDLLRFDLEVIVADHGRIHTEYQTLKLRTYCPLVLYGALMLLKQYQNLTRRARGAYYEQLAHIRELLKLAAEGDDDDGGLSRTSA